MNRAEKIRLMLAHAAAAKALREDLEHSARHEVEVEHVRPTWSQPGIATFASVEHNAALIADPEAFMDYLEQHYPTEVVRREIREVRVPKWLAEQLEKWAALGPVPPPEGALPDDLPGVRTEDGDIIPGLRWKRGGSFKTLTVRPDSTTARRIAAAARRYVLGAVPMQAVEAAAVAPVEPDDEI